MSTKLDRYLIVKETHESLAAAAVIGVACPARVNEFGLQYENANDYHGPWLTAGGKRLFVQAINSHLGTILETARALAASEEIAALAAAREESFEILGGAQ